MTTYSNIFDGETVSPAYPNARDINLTENQQLEWPSTLLNTANIAAYVMFVDSDNATNEIALPDATLVSVGQSLIFQNIGANNFIVTDFDGTQLFAAVTPGQQYLLTLRSKSTAAGVWGVILLGSGTSSASAVALAGDGLIALNNLLNLNTPISLISTNTSILPSDRAEFFVWTGGAGTVTLPDPADVDITDGYLIALNNQTTTAGQVNVIVDGGETIDGLTTFPLFAGNSAIFVTDGIKYYTIGNGRDVTVNVTVLNLTIPTGATTVTLTAEQAANQIQIYSGVLTANVKIVVPTSAAVYYVFNTTSGAFTLSMGSSGVNTYVVPQGTRQIFWHNGVSEIYDSVDSISNNLTVTGTVTAANATITSTVQAPNINAGSSGSVGTLTVFPSTAARGRLTITASNTSAGDTITNVNLAAQNAARTYTIPNAGADASFVMTESTQTINGAKSFGSTVSSAGSFAATAIGGGLQVKTGVNSRIGSGTLSGGTLSVANTSVTANTKIFLTRANKNASNKIGVLEGVCTAGVGFVINSYDPTTSAPPTLEAADVSTIDWMLVESIP